jgi:hypothetical protein
LRIVGNRRRSWTKAMSEILAAAFISRIETIRNGDSSPLLPLKRPDAIRLARGARHPGLRLRRSHYEQRRVFRWTIKAICLSSDLSTACQPKN